MPALVVSASRSIIGSDLFDLPLFGLHDISRHANLSEALGPWAGGIADIYNAGLHRANIGRAMGGLIRDQEDFPSRLFSPAEKEPQIGKSFPTGTSRPEYIVVSYTWGRFEAPPPDPNNDPHVPGCDWKVPHNSEFTRIEFSNAIRKMAGGSKIWVDVFCIPQNDCKEKDQEIGKQGAIFRNSSRACVWLGTGGDKVLEEVCSWVPDWPIMTTPDILALRDINMLKDDVRAEEHVQETCRRIRLIASFTDKVPWASSLWTLQEAALCPDAVFHGKSGDPVLHKQSKQGITIKHLMLTMRYIREALGRLFDSFHYNQVNQGVLDRPERVGLSETDIDYIFKAFDTINTVSLDRMAVTNAGELVLTSRHRVESNPNLRPNDRVYGIMGAIGANVDVNYDKSATEVMEDFLIELHNKFPAEMQAFHRDSMFRPDKSHWLMDQGAKLLTLMRQKSAPPAIFTGITPGGHLVVSEVTRLSKRGLHELNSRILTMSILPALDGFAFKEVSNGAVKRISKSNYGDEYLHLSIILQLIGSKTELGLISLGEITGLEHKGWNFVYMLVAFSQAKTDSDGTIMRLGLLIMRAKMLIDKPSNGRFLLL